MILIDRENHVTVAGFQYRKTWFSFYEAKSAAIVGASLWWLQCWWSVIIQSALIQRIKKFGAVNSHHEIMWRSGRIVPEILIQDAKWR